MHNGMLMAFAERWHPETSSFHLPYSEITITLDGIACLLHIPIRGTLLAHGRMTKEEAREVLIAEVGADPEDALEEVEKTCGAHVRFSFLTRRYEAELLAAQQAAGDLVDENIHKQWVLRCYFLFLLGTQLFVDTISLYTYVVYLRYLSDTARIHEYN
ncbi:protein MAIN-LIKE 1-like [Vicia villosa]|uniref:protein MAIN-LIKE 1-like n=1 Tax=Vicia villosa TaxID=3911 RepID=UPI00273AF211|nr:protein MAIN-LIKE 1-like [Vicia villosa]